MVVKLSRKLKDRLNTMPDGTEVLEVGKPGALVKEVSITGDFYAIYSWDGLLVGQGTEEYARFIFNGLNNK